MKKKALLHHDNAPAHTCAVADASWSYEVVPHPACSPDSFPSDLFLFPNLKKSLAGQKFESNKEVIAATEAHFAAQEKTYFSDVIKKLEDR